jgi:Bacterial Ig domain
MKIFKSTPTVFLRATVAALLAAAIPLTHAANVFWTGPTTTFTHASFSTTVDKLTTNHVGTDAVNNVWLTRGSRAPLYNAAAESAWNGSTSPLNTQWAVASGPLTSAASLTYGTFGSVVGQPGHSPSASVGKTFYVKIISDNIYFSLTLSAWGASDGGSFTYQRSTPAVVVTPPTPTVSLTNPASGAVFAAPANVSLGANATVSSGTVTNVQFFTNGVSLRSILTAPFSLTANNLAAGAYALTAVATAAGISATSAVVNVSVVNPVVVSLSGTMADKGQFSFSYPANPGLAYVVQSSSNLVDWVSLMTNVAPGSPVLFTNALNSAASFYRVGRLPNP